MKIAICSDIHNEFDMWKPINDVSADTLILAGDIDVINNIYPKKLSQLKFFAQCSKLYKNVIYVVGNHEYYHGDFQCVFKHVKETLQKFDNIHVLNNEYVKIDDMVFFGSTLWTNCDNENPIYMMEIERIMNDFYYISNGDRKFTVEDSIQEFKKSFKFLRDNLWKFKKDKVVVVTHHSPSYRSVPEEFKYDYALNSAYASNLDQFILDRPQIKCWVYGHSHTPKDFTIGETMLINNARGYVGRERDSNKLNPYYPKIVEI